MKLPIETKKKAAGDWVIIDDPEGINLALPESWLKGGLRRYDVVAQGLDPNTAARQADWAIGPGEHKGALRDIDHLHGIVNQIYTLVDEGYVDGKHAILAFR